MATKLEPLPNTKDGSRTSCIVLLVGLPGAGKTTFAKILSQANAAASCATVSFDEVLPLEEQKALSTAVSSSGNKWKLARQDMKDRVRKEMAERNDDVIVFVDDNNYYRSMRHEYYQLARELQVGFCQFYLKVTAGPSVQWVFHFFSKFKHLTFYHRCRSAPFLPIFHFQWAI